MTFWPIAGSFQGVAFVAAPIALPKPDKSTVSITYVPKDKGRRGYTIRVEKK